MGVQRLQKPGQIATIWREEIDHCFGMYLGEMVGTIMSWPLDGVADREINGRLLLRSFSLVTEWVLQAMATRSPYSPFQQ